MRGWRALASGGAWIALAALALTAGCATATTRPAGEAAVTDFHQVAGAWKSTGGSGLQGNLIVQTNGRFWMTTGRAVALHGQLLFQEGVLRFDTGPDSRRGRATLVEDRGRELLRFTDDTGQVWMECERNL
jgi:hypothetical protein